MNGQLRSINDEVAIVLVAACEYSAWAGGGFGIYGAGTYGLRIGSAMTRQAINRQLAD